MFPCCDEVNSEEGVPHPSWRQDLDEPSLIVQAFELGEVLLKKKVVRLKASGFCMYPLIRNSDTLHVRPCKINDVVPGDVPVFRREGALVAHRAVEKKTVGERACLITQADNSRHQDSAPVFGEDILGILEGIERGGRVFLPREKKADFLEKAAFFLHKIRQSLWSALRAFAFFFQRFKWYRYLAGPLLSGSFKNGVFTVSLPLNLDLDSRFQQVISCEEFERFVASSDPSRISQFKLCLRSKGKTLAAVLFLRRPEGCPFSGWWMTWFRMQDRYQGVGLEAKLFRQAQRFLGQMKAAYVFASIPDGCHCPSPLYKLGFERVDLGDQGLASGKLILKKQIQDLDIP